MSDGLVSVASGGLVGRLPTRTRDRRLIARASHGEAAAFEAIFKRYNDEIYRYCRSILGNSADAEDALQNTMASALRALPGESREIALRPWLYRVAHNHAISIARARRPHEGEERLAEVCDPNLEERPEVRERLRTLVGDLNLLPERQRGALTMRELNGLAFEEIGAALEMSPAAARQAVYEARVSLQEMEAGREMECESVREVISGGDRRALRARRLRAHLSACDGCTAFEIAITRRTADFQMLAPALPVVAASGIVHSVLASAGSSVTGGSAAGGAGGAVALGAGKGAASVLVAKSAASVVAATALGLGSADATGMVDLGLPGGREPARVTADPMPRPGPAAPAATAPGNGAGPGPASQPAVTNPPAAAANPAAGGAGHGAGAPSHGDGPPAHANGNGNGPPADAPAGGGPSHPWPGPPADVPASPSAGPPAHATDNDTGPPAHAVDGIGGPPVHAGGNSQPAPAEPAPPVTTPAPGPPPGAGPPADAGPPPAVVPGTPALPPASSAPTDPGSNGQGQGHGNS